MTILSDFVILFEFQITILSVKLRFLSNGRIFHRQLQPVIRLYHFKFITYAFEIEILKTEIAEQIIK